MRTHSELKEGQNCDWNQVCDVAGELQQKSDLNQRKSFLANRKGTGLDGFAFECDDSAPEFHTNDWKSPLEGKRMVSVLIGTELPRKGLRVRVPCLPLKKPRETKCFTGFFCFEMVGSIH